MDQDVTQALESGQPTCPECGKGDPLRIVYGFPMAALIEASQRGEVALGGCVVSRTSHQWRCRRCGYEWGPPPSWIDGLAAYVLPSHEDRS